MARTVNPPLPRKRRPASSSSELDRLIEEATVDAYNESEQVTWFYTMIEDNMAFPFETEVLGVKVVVTGVDLTDDEQIVAVCKRGKSRQRIPVLEAKIAGLPPLGARCDGRQ